MCDAVDIKFRRPDTNRLQPECVDRLKRRELKLFRPQREKRLKLRIGKQPCIQQLSIRYPKVREETLKYSIVPQSHLKSFVLTDTICQSDSRRHKSLPSRLLSANT